MRKILLLVTIVLISTVFLNAQDPPAAPTAPVLRDDNIRLRSVDLERTKQDADKLNAAESGNVRKEIDKKYPEIKEDFESMQLAQAAIIKAYTTGKTIDYVMIKVSSEKINKNSKRLESNLFIKKTKMKSKEKKQIKKKSVRDLIIALDGAIGDVISSKMFTNLRVVEPKIAKKTQKDIKKIMMISEQLSKSSKNMMKSK